MNTHMRRICTLFCCALVLLQLRQGRVSWYDYAQKRWTQTNVCADALCRRDRELLQRGLRFDTRAGLTRALEDFCS